MGILRTDETEADRGGAEGMVGTGTSTAQSRKSGRTGTASCGPFSCRGSTGSAASGPPSHRLSSRDAYARRRCLACFGDLLVHRRSDDVLTDDKSIAVAQSMRRLEAAFSTVHERAVGRDVVKPVGAVVPTYLAMLARDETAGIRQGPIEILIATDIEATFTLDRNAQWPAVRQGRLIFDSQRQRHGPVSATRMPSESQDGSGFVLWSEFSRGIQISHAYAHRARGCGSKRRNLSRATPPDSMNSTFPVLSGRAHEMPILPLTATRRVRGAGDPKALEKLACSLFRIPNGNSDRCDNETAPDDEMIGRRRAGVDWIRLTRNIADRELRELLKCS